MVVQQLRLCASTAEGAAFDPWSGNWDPTCHRAWPKKVMIINNNKGFFKRTLLWCTLFPVLPWPLPLLSLPLSSTASCVPTLPVSAKEQGCLPRGSTWAPKYLGNASIASWQTDPSTLILWRDSENPGVLPAHQSQIISSPVLWIKL